MFKVLFTIMFFCSFLANVSAQNSGLAEADSIRVLSPQPAPGSAASETGKILSDTILYINSIVIPEDSVNKWKADDRFAYIKDLEKKLKKKQQEMLVKAMPGGNTGDSFFQKILNSGLLKTILWLMAIVFVSVVLYNLLIVKGVFKRSQALPPDEEMPAGSVAGTVSDYERLLSLSVSNGDYRLAVRYHYLRLLTQLSEKELLQLAPGKTNDQYLQEINAGLKADFATLLRIYEYTWYGNVGLTSLKFGDIEKNFNDFYGKI